MLSLRNIVNTDQPAWPEYMDRRAAEARDERLRRFFKAGVPDPETPLKNVRMVALDLETTGMDVSRHAIVSIGMVPFTINRIQAGRSYYQVVRPRRMLREESVLIHHITHSEIAHAPDLNDVLGELLEHLTGFLPVVHYHPIERRFLNDSVKARLGESLLFPMIDTMVLEARWQRQSFRARLNKWFGGQPQSIRLHESRERYSLPFYRGHHALTDALATAELLQAQVAHRFTPETPVSKLWV